MQAHRPRAAFGVIGVNELGCFDSEIDQDDDVAVNAAVCCSVFFRSRRTAQADRRPQFFFDGVVKDASVMAAGILHPIMHAGLPQRRFQTARATSAGMAVDESVDRFQTMMASQRLQGAPAAPSRRSILDPAVGRDVNLGIRRGGEES
ncbi:MAG: hypothetical protein ACYC3I_17235 [Gemmataceae bacterium]